MAIKRKPAKCERLYHLSLLFVVVEDQNGWGEESGNIYYVHIIIRYIMEHTWREGNTISSPSMVIVPLEYRLMDRYTKGIHQVGSPVWN